MPKKKLIENSPADKKEDAALLKSLSPKATGSTVKKVPPAKPAIPPAGEMKGKGKAPVIKAPSESSMMPWMKGMSAKNLPKKAK